jgi:hypothetical protein
LFTNLLLRIEGPCPSGFEGPHFLRGCADQHLLQSPKDNHFLRGSRDHPKTVCCMGSTCQRPTVAPGSTCQTIGSERGLKIFGNFDHPSSAAVVGRRRCRFSTTAADKATHCAASLHRRMLQACLPAGGPAPDMPREGGKLKYAPSCFATIHQCALSIVHRRTSSLLLRWAPAV